MKCLREYIQGRLNSSYAECQIANVLSNINKSLLIWSSSGISSLHGLFDESKYNFDNCEDVVEKIVNVLYNIELNKQTLKFDFNNTFFKHLILEINIGNRIIGGHEKRSLPSDTVSFELQILKNKSVDEYSLREHRKLRYMIIHELTHAYENFLIKQDGNEAGIFYPEDSKEYKKYNISINWILSGRQLPKLKEELILCGYFLDEHEKFAYLGTVKETVKNVIEKVIPSYKDLKFNEIIEMFKDEFNWESYIKISAFIDGLSENKTDKDLRYKICRLYNSIYEDEQSEDNIINELINKWEDFKKEFVHAFIDAYAECEADFKLEYYIDPDLSNRVNS